MQVTKTQTLSIKSQNRIRGNMNDFCVFLGDQQIKAEDINSQIRLSVIHFCINRSYYTIEDNITCTVNNITLNTSNNFIIPSGYYDVYSFRTYLLSILTNWNITYSKSNNTYTFIPPSGNVYSFTFANSGYLFGFNNITTQYFITSSPLTSSIPVNMNMDNSIFLRTSIPRARFCAIDNLNSSTFNESDILCVIPMTFKPFQNIVLSDSNQFTFYMSNKELTSFRLYITDENGNLLPFKIDYTLALKFEYLKPKEEDYVLNTLQEIRDLLQYTTLDKFL